MCPRQYRLRSHLYGVYIDPDFVTFVQTHYKDLGVCRHVELTFVVGL